MPLNEAARVRLLEALATDESLKATQRLRALEELGRMEARRMGATAVAERTADDVSVDPMGDLDEVERARRKRAGRTA